jgi:hypothetical protein
VVRGSARQFDPTPVHTEALFGQQLREPGGEILDRALAVAQANSVAVAFL